MVLWPKVCSGPQIVGGTPESDSESSAFPVRFAEPPIYSVKVVLFWWLVKLVQTSLPVYFADFSVQEKIDQLCPFNIDNGLWVYFAKFTKCSPQVFSASIF